MMSKSKCKSQENFLNNDLDRCKIYKWEVVLGALLSVHFKVF